MTDWIKSRSESKSTIDEQMRQHENNQNKQQKFNIYSIIHSSFVSLLCLPFCVFAAHEPSPSLTITIFFLFPLIRLTTSDFRIQSVSQYFSFRLRFNRFSFYANLYLLHFILFAEATAPKWINLLLFSSVKGSRKKAQRKS